MVQDFWLCVVMWGTAAYYRAWSGIFGSVLWDGVMSGSVTYCTVTYCSFWYGIFGSPQPFLTIAVIISYESAKDQTHCYEEMDEDGIRAYNRSGKAENDRTPAR
jgi:hypothetical protein